MKLAFCSNCGHAFSVPKVPYQTATCPPPCQKARAQTIDNGMTQVTHGVVVYGNKDEALVEAIQAKGPMTFWHIKVPGTTIEVVP